ncbi:C40 family peptidase [Algihabitans albus]|uniref:C40 family peptidase n=1 Tax=Algihabitans albus TaxID=2164067 RepID=UPI000E5CE5D5|nr:NlpC/P60 family protein [Algihabitans albus]
MSDLDRRLHALRDDLADLRLQGRVEAIRFVEGRPAAVAVGTAGLRRSPGGRLDSQLLLGEPLLVFEERDGWAWLQSEADGYVGYVETPALAPRGPAATHRVATRSTLLFPEPDIKAPILEVLTLTTTVAVTGREKRFAVTPQGYIWADHLISLGETLPDYVETALTFLHTPYLWGGKSAAGVDCSGLIQLSLTAAGVACPRDTDMQEACAELGTSIDPEAPLRRGDLVFWKGHVAIALDAETVVNATAHYLSTVIEPLAVLDSRARADSPEGITTVRRPSI